MANMCVNDTGYKNAEKTRFDAIKTAANYKYAVAAAQIALNASAAITNFKKLNDIAGDALTLEEEQQAHLKDVYWPSEEQMLNEFTQPTPWEGQAILAKRYAGRIWPPLASQFAKEMQKLKCEKPRYCATAYKQKVQELEAQRALTHANVSLWADRIAYYEIQAVQETDFKRRQQVIAMRQGLIGQAASLIEQARNGFAGAFGKSMKAITNAIEFIGYTSTRSMGRGADPGFHARTMQTAQQMDNASFEAEWSRRTQGLEGGVSFDNAAFDAQWNAGMQGVNGGVSFDSVAFDAEWNAGMQGINGGTSPSAPSGIENMEVR